MPALDLLDQAVANPKHVHISVRDDVDNVHIINKRPTGTSADAGHRRLRSHATGAVIETESRYRTIYLVRNPANPFLNDALSNPSKAS